MTCDTPLEGYAVEVATMTKSNKVIHFPSTTIELSEAEVLELVEGLPAEDQLAFLVRVFAISSDMSSRRSSSEAKFQA